METVLLTVGGSAGTAATVGGTAATIGGSAATLGLGSAGTAITLGHVATGASLLSGVASGFQQKYAYDLNAQNALLQQSGVKMQQEAEKLRAREEGNLRRERLLNALAAQNVRAGAGGVRGGSVDALMLESTEAFQREQASGNLMSQYQQGQYLAQSAGYGAEAKASKLQGKAALTGSLLGLGTELARIG